MKILFKVLAAAALTTTASSCSSFLDVNTNPNSYSSVTGDAILATALTTTAANYTGGPTAAAPIVLTSFNSYGSWVADYWGKSGVVNGFPDETTYNYTNTSYAGLFTNTYDNLNDYQLIQNQGAAYPNHAAIARIMKVYNYLLLVDEYGDIPYSQALLAAANTAPAYDSAPVIYRDFIVQLNGAISDINAAASGRAVGPEDVVFGGNMTKWKQFANSLKLRILLRQSSTKNADLNTYVATQMATLQNPDGGFITADVVVQPGYAQNSNQQNPFYNRYGYTIAGTSAAERQYEIPTQFVLNQYLNNKDPRLTQLYVIGARGGTDVTGPQVPEWIGAVPGEQSSPLFVAPIVGSRFLGSSTGAPTTTGGFFKGLNAPTILMMVSEHLFSKAEAETRGLLPGGDGAAKADFQSGTAAAFQTNYRTATGALAPVPDVLTGTSTAVGIPQYQAYVAANTTNALVDWDATTTTLSTQGIPGTARAVSKQEKIIYQKYLAMNLLGSIEAWDDYRRTTFPKIPASIQSVINDRPDRLPTRLLYPLAEANSNKANVPTTATRTTKIFWDELD